MNNNKDENFCTQHDTCLYRLDCLEKWREVIDHKLNGLAKLLIANLTGVILSLIAIIGGLLVYLVKVK